MLNAYSNTDPLTYFLIFHTVIAFQEGESEKAEDQ
jgi:hypothetical protein